MVSLQKRTTAAIESIQRIYDRTCHDKHSIRAEYGCRNMGFWTLWRVGRASGGGEAAKGKALIMRVDSAGNMGLRATTVGLDCRHAPRGAWLHGLHGSVVEVSLQKSNLTPQCPLVAEHALCAEAGSCPAARPGSVRSGNLMGASESQ